MEKVRATPLQHLLSPLFFNAPPVRRGRKFDLRVANIHPSETYSVLPPVTGRRPAMSISSLAITFSCMLTVDL